MGKYAAAVQEHLVAPARVALTYGRQQALQLLGRRIPEAVLIRLVIDTGSSRSTLISPVLAQLDPPIAGMAKIETGLGFSEASLFWVRLEFPDTSLAPIPEIAVARLPLPPSLHAFHGVLGRDLLRRWEYLLYQGRKQQLAIRDRPWWSRS